MQTPASTKTGPTGESPPLTGKRLAEALDFQGINPISNNDDSILNKRISQKEQDLKEAEKRLEIYTEKLKNAKGKRNQKRIRKEIERAKKWIDKYNKKLAELYNEMPSSPSQTPRFRF